MTWNTVILVSLLITLNICACILVLLFQRVLLLTLNMFLLDKMKDEMFSTSLERREFFVQLCGAWNVNIFTCLTQARLDHLVILTCFIVDRFIMKGGGVVGNVCIFRLHFIFPYMFWNVSCCSIWRDDVAFYLC